MKDSLKGLWPIGWLAAACFLAFLPMFFFRYWIHWDLEMATLPHLIYVQDAFRSGQIPLWNPFQDCGWPIFSDPSQSFLWYPINHMIIWTMGFSMRSLQYELLFHYLLAGISAYLFGRKLELSRPGACLAGASYMLSGFFVGHGEHLPIVTSFAWLPLSLAAIQGWLNDKKRGNLWLFGASLLLMLLGGGASSNLIALLFIGLFMALRIAERWRARPSKNLIGAELVPLLAAGLIPALLAGVFLAPVFSDFTDYMGQAGGISYQYSLESNSLPAWSLVTLFAPILPINGVLHRLNPEPSVTMVNLYMGMVSLPLALFAIYARRNRNTLSFTALGIAALLIALGGQGILRGVLYEFVPFFNSFRHAGVFRGIFILFFSLLAGIGLDEICKNDPSLINPFRRSLLMLISGLGAGVLMALVAILALFVSDNQSTALLEIDRESLWMLKEVFIKSMPLQIAVLLAFYFWLRSSIKFWATGILFLASLDLALMIQPNLPLACSKYTSQEYQVLMAQIKTIKNRNRDTRNVQADARIDNWGWYDNSGEVTKKLQTSSYSPYRSRDYKAVMDTGFHRLAGKAPCFFMVPAVSYQKDLQSSLPVFADAANRNLMPVMVNETPPAGFPLLPEAAYRPEELLSEKVNVPSYSINRVELEFSNQAPAFLATTEGFHKGWRATLDGKKVATVKTNFAFRGVYVMTPGPHRLLFEFKPSSFFQGLGVSISGVLILGAWLLAAFRKSRAKDTSPTS